MPPKPNKMLPALYGGIIMAFISAVPFLNLLNCLCCAGVMLGGFMAVFFYKNEIKEGMLPLESADALALGAIAGVFGAVIGTLLTWGLFALLGNVAGETLVNILKNTVGNQMPPEALDQMERSMAQTGITFAHLIMSLVIDTLFGLVGGLIGYQVFKPKVAPVMPPPPPLAR